MGLVLDRYRYLVSVNTRQYLWVSVSADTYLSIGADTSSPVARLHVSTVNTVATHACSFKPITYFRAFTPHTYTTCTHPYSAQNHIFSKKKIVQPGIGISVAAADNIGYQVSGACSPARYRSNPRWGSQFIAVHTAAIIIIIIIFYSPAQHKTNKDNNS